MDKQEPTSRAVSDYTILVTTVENGIWQAQLKELPGVITVSRSWVKLLPMLRDALKTYQDSRQ